MKKNKIILFAILSLFYAIGYAQDAPKYSQNKKAIKIYNKAIDFLKSEQFNEAIERFNLATEMDSNFLEAYLYKAEIYNFKGNSEMAFRNYVKVFEIDPHYDPAFSFILAANYYRKGEYDEAKDYIDFFSENVDTLKAKKYDHKRLREYIYFADSAFNNPLDFNPISVGDGVNTDFDEYWPSLSVDEEILVFTRQIPKSPNIKSNHPENMHEDLFIARKDKNSFRYEYSVPLSDAINTLQNEGAQCVSADGKTVIFTACNRPNGVGSCDLYIMFYQNNMWTKPQNLKSINTPSWESNPSLSADGSTLYFASNRGNGHGKSDIWKVNIDKRGNAISAPQNLGNTVNTAFEEVSPFIHPDGQTLYFASKGFPGLGDLDLYFSRLDSIGNWQKPVNIGYPINTKGEERSLIVNAKGNLAMYASTADQDNLNIYFFEIPDGIKPTTVTYVRGTVYDKKTNKRLEAVCELLELESGELTAKTESGINGEYMVCLPINKDYAFNVSKKGYLFYSENFSLSNLEDPEKPYVLDIYLQPIEENITVVLKNIFFELNSYELLPESHTELSVIIKYMNTNPSLKIEIGGHTDNTGSKSYNKTLSTNRARSVYNYLVSKGISKDRLSFKGYDFSMPLGDNNTEEGRAQNRRTEFKILTK